jgi:hypothetical protein
MSDYVEAAKNGGATFDAVRESKPK